MDDRVRIIGTKTLAHEWGHLRQTTLELRRRDGSWQRQVRESYNRGNAAATLLYNPRQRTVVLTRQFRYPVFENGDPPWLIEVCAGMLEGDDPESCARKEAEEETGYRVADVRHVFDGYMSPGSVTEKLSFFVATYDPASRVSAGGGLAEEGEDIEVLELGFDAALDMLRRGEITDAKTVMLLQYAALEGLLEAK